LICRFLSLFCFQITFLIALIFFLQKPQAAMLEPKFSHPEAPPMHNGLSYPLTALFSATPGLLAEAIMHKRAPL
jgi:hypothetical protein